MSADLGDDVLDPLSGGRSGVHGWPRQHRVRQCLAVWSYRGPDDEHAVHGQSSEPGERDRLVAWGTYVDEELIPQLGRPQGRYPHSSPVRVSDGQIEMARTPK